MGAARASKAGSIVVLVASAAMVLPGAPGVSWADPPPLGSACTIDGTAGPDILNGTSGSDVICGNGGDDTLKGLGGDDLILGGNGNDTIDGGSGDDDLRGGNGDDTLSGATGEDAIYGDDDDDDLLGGNDDDLVVGGLGEDDVRGNNGADQVFGREDADVVYGGDGNDVLRGGAGSDDHFGQVGDDVIYDRDGAGNVDDASCGDGTDVARVDFYDNVNADCERRRNLDREDPVAVADAATVDEDDAATTVDVLANDTDLDEGPIEIDSVTQPTNGTVVITNGGADLTYEPDPDYCNDGSPTDDFTYTLAPGGDTATVAMTVSCVADVPVAEDDTKTVVEDDTATTIDVLANDDDEGQVIAITGVTQPTNGTVVITNAGADLTYQPNADYCNDGSPTDDFTYTITGGDTATVEVTVTCVDDAADAVDDTATVGEDATATTIDVLANDSDAEADAFSITAITQPANGTVAVTNAGADLTYEPDDNYCNDGVTTDDFTYTITGGDIATVQVTVTCVSDPAVAADDDKTVAEDDAATTIDVLANDTEGDTGTISIVSVTQPTDGTVVITNAGADLTYEPNDNYCNDPPGTTTDDFTYTLTPDGDTATVEVTVTCVNDAPVADDESYTGANAAVGNTVLVHNDATDGAPTEAGPKKSITGDLLDGDTDIDSAGPLTITAETVSTADGGTIVIETDGDFVYTPAAGTSCTDHSDSFDYELNDGDGETDTGTVTIETNGCVWYVNNNATGNAGTSNAPFDTLAQAETASAANDTIYVHDGDDTTTGYGAGITLKLNQRLLGEVSDLVVGADTLATGVVGKRPTLTDAAAAVVVLAAGNTVRGIEIDPQGGEGIAGGAGDAGGTITDVRIIDVTPFSTLPSLTLGGTSGAFTISDLAIDSRAGISAFNNTGTVTFVPASTIELSVTGAPSFVVSSTNLGTSQIDSISQAGGNGAVALDTTTGSITFGALGLSTNGHRGGVRPQQRRGRDGLREWYGEYLRDGWPRRGRHRGGGGRPGVRQRQLDQQQHRRHQPGRADDRNLQFLQRHDQRCGRDRVRPERGQRTRHLSGSARQRHRCHRGDHRPHRRGRHPQRRHSRQQRRRRWHHRQWQHGRQHGLQQRVEGAQHLRVQRGLVHRERRSHVGALRRRAGHRHVERTRPRTPTSAAPWRSAGRATRSTARPVARSVWCRPTSLRPTSPSSRSPRAAVARASSSTPRATSATWSSLAPEAPAPSPIRRAAPAAPFRTRSGSMIRVRRRAAPPSCCGTPPPRRSPGSGSTVRRTTASVARTFPDSPWPTAWSTEPSAPAP